MAKTTAPTTTTTDPATSKKAAQILSAGRYIVRQTVPYFTPVMLKLVMREDSRVETITTSKAGICRYNAGFIARTTPKETAGLLVHESMHLTLLHYDRVGARDPQRFNIAGDRAINPGILACGLELPGFRKGTEDLLGCYPKQIGMADGLTADEYYARDDDKKGHGSGGCGGGGCGGCAGNPHPIEADDAGDPGARTPAELSRAARETAEAMRDAAGKRAGNVPGDWARMVGETLEPPKVPWTTKLARALRVAVGFRPGAVVTSYDMPSRRQGGIGFGPGRPVLPRFRAPIPHVGVGIDTSGSMGADELTAGAIETRGILRAVGSEISYFACDTVVHRKGRARRVEDIIANLHGGGGTDFRPVFTALEAERPRPEVLVFITDGYGPAPAVAPAWCRTIWLLVGPQTRRPAPWGEVIDISENMVDDDDS